MTSTFKEFLLTIKTCTLDVALLSETWLRDQKELLDYVSIDRRCFDIEKTQPDLEHLWLEL
ncbi:unnamed protein product [Pocillopora meandrina]|uniref:Uncharacterized protein n=1 Tax=Pocillopora meandrina TaxID=46732 RepID=A0AAU9XRU1_9CNID|nr:unnamed protein product [Pocillopora meandrina]